ncbi:MAG: thiamine ABC transporter substrate-binding protein [Candidatus Thermoplasmatota archaeon]|nr:thiamine ABC transporter substrate-binding protein [Candidatus Thermoplasmatota archaeon]
MNPTRESGKAGLRPFEKKLIGVAIAVLVVIAGFSLYFSLNSHHSSGNTIVIYTYGSFLADGSNKTQAYDQVFGPFEKEYGVTVKVENPTDGILATLEAEKKNPQADIVIGLTNINGIEAANDGLLVKYSSPADSYINSTLINEMGPAAAYMTPYEYSYLGIDYNHTNFPGGVFNPDFQDLLTKENASNLIMESPATSSTGEGFLLWEIAYYQYLLHENWTSWWSSVKSYASTNLYNSWSSAFTHFESSPKSALMVSYLTDPSYNVYFGYGNFIGSTVTQHNGTEYGWRTIYNIAIVNGTGQTQLDEKFINYFLSGSVQAVLPTNEWMYPANQTVPLPSVFSANMNPSDIVPLNQYINAEMIQANLQTWIYEWLSIME